MTLPSPISPGGTVTLRSSDKSNPLHCLLNSFGICHLCTGPGADLIQPRSSGQINLSVSSPGRWRFPWKAPWQGWLTTLRLPSRRAPRKPAGAGMVLGFPDPYLGRVGQDLLHVLGHSDRASGLDFVRKMPQHRSHRVVFYRVFPGAEIFSSPKAGNDCEKHTLNKTY